MRTLLTATSSGIKPIHCGLSMLTEVNRGDLGYISGEAIYLFETRDITHGEGRRVTLPHRLVHRHP